MGLTLSSVRQNGLGPAKESHTLGTPSLRLSTGCSRPASLGFDPGSPFFNRVTLSSRNDGFSLHAQLPTCTHRGQPWVEDSSPTQERLLPEQEGHILTSVSTVSSQRPERKGRFGDLLVKPEDQVVTSTPSHCREQQPLPSRALSEALEGSAPQQVP